MLLLRPSQQLPYRQPRLMFSQHSPYSTMLSWLDGAKLRRQHMPPLFLRWNARQQLLAEGPVYGKHSQVLRE